MLLTLECPPLVTAKSMAEVEFLLHHEQRVPWEGAERDSDGRAISRRMFQVPEEEGFRALEASDADIKLIRKYAPDGISAEEVWVRELWLAHNQVDRGGERFTDGILKDFAKSAPGTSFMWETPHEWRMPGQGRIFWAEVIELKGVKWVHEKFYYLREGNEDAHRNFGKGIWHAVSIGFAASAIILKLDKDGNVLWVEVDGPGEQYEGSVVGVGQQQGAHLKNLEGASGGIEIRSAPAEKTATGGIAMDVKIGKRTFDLELKNAGDAGDLIKELAELQDAAEKGTEVKALTEERNTVKAQLEELTKAVELGEGVDILDAVKSMTAMARIGEEARKALIEDTIKAATLAGTVKDEEKELEAERAHLGALSFERLQTENARAKAAYAKINPAGGANLTSMDSADPQGGEGDGEAARKRAAEAVQRKHSKIEESRKRLAR